MSEARLERIVFRTSRLLDFTSRRELTTQMGHEPSAWPSVAVKELVDNALDACEEAGTAPEVAIEIVTEPGKAAITVRDNGPGIAAETVTDILDFSVRVSSREAYVSPTRGAQGNALKTIIAMPHALDGARGVTLIESCGITHRITFRADAVRQEPRIEHRSEPAIVKTGTSVTVFWPANACVGLVAAKSRFLQMAAEYAFLNPHLTLSLDWDGERLVEMPATNPAWVKWRACDPTCPYWYDAARLARYAAALVNHDRERGARVRTVREFLSEFRGLSGSARQKRVLEACGLVRSPLDVLFNDGTPDFLRIRRLLAAMCEETRPVKPRDLGSIGDDHWCGLLKPLGCEESTFRYRCIANELEGHLPYVVEAAFAERPERTRALFTGVNFAAALGNPFRTFRHEYEGLETLLAEQYCRNGAEVALFLHLTSPVVGYRDRGKTALALPEAVATSVTDAVETVTRDWARKRKAEERRDRRTLRDWVKEHRATDRNKRPTNEIVGSGVLYREIADAAAASSWSINDLTVLSPTNDPYRLDTVEGHQLGQWFADQVARFLGPAGRVHLRGLFYRIVAAGDVVEPDGKVFTNTHDNWVWLQAKAAKAARWLDYVPFERISDERNAAPQLFLPERQPSAGNGSLTSGLAVEMPGSDAAMPRLTAIAPCGRQPYRIVMIGEKSSLADVLAPIARAVEGELLLPTGEATDTMIAEMAARAAAADRPTIVLYFSDFDPSGHQMAVSVARKLQALRTLRHSDLRIEVHRVALTLDQVRQFELPSTPLKVTEKRAERWRQNMGHEQTEIDALAALRPGDLRQIALDAIAPFFDDTLAARCEAAREAWLAESEQKIAGHPALAAARAQIAERYADATAAVRALHEVQAEAHARLITELGIGNAVIPTPMTRLETAPPAPLMSTEQDFASASRRLIAEKQYED